MTRIRRGVASPVIAVAVLVAASLLFAACAATVPPSTAVPDGWQLTVAELRACHDAPRTLAARAHLRFEGAGVYHTAAALVTVRFPDSLRIEIRDPFGRAVVTVVADGGRVRALNALEGVYYDGPATPANVGRFLTIPMDVPDAVRIATGLVLRDRDVARALQTPDGLWSLDEGGIDWRRWRVTVDPLRPAAVAASMEESGAPSVLVETSDFGDGSGCAFPRKIRLTAVESGSQVHIIFSSRDWDAPLADDAFVLPIPDGARVVVLPGLE